MGGGGNAPWHALLKCMALDLKTMQADGSKRCIAALSGLLHLRRNLCRPRCTTFFPQNLNSLQGNMHGGKHGFQYRFSSWDGMLQFLGWNVPARLLKSRIGPTLQKKLPCLRRQQSRWHVTDQTLAISPGVYRCRCKWNLVVAGLAQGILDD